MNKLLKCLKITLIAILCLSFSLLLVACGEPGEKGDKGDTGAAGEPGVGIVSIAKTSTAGIVDIYTITLSNGTTTTFTVTNGANGTNGINGTNGVDGKDGISITNAQIVNGELVLSFSKGDPINLGKVVGTNGTNGTNGVDGKDGVGIKGIVLSPEGELTITLTNNTPINLGNIKGQKGDTGAIGLGIAKTEINEQGELVVTYDDETFVNLGVIVGAKGDTGIGIKSVSLDNDYLTITLTDGTVYELGNVKGDQGDKGDTGATGKSAYEIYKEKNPSYTGDEDQWLSDLVNGKLATIEVVKYTVTFDSNGGSLVDSQQVIAGQKAIQPDNPTREGYTFHGWYGGKYGDEKWVFIGYDVTENITLVAKWQEIVVIPDVVVTFNTNGGLTIESDVIDDDFVMPANPIKQGFYFDGWYFDSALTQFATMSAILAKTESFTLYAKWIEKSVVNDVNVTFETNGGSTIPSDVIDADFVMPAEPTKIGFIFDGWYFDSALTHLATMGSILSKTESFTLYAKWVHAEFVYTIEDNQVTITSYIGSNTEIVIPSTIDNKPVVAIGASAFSGNTEITSVTISDGVTSIGASAFENCATITSIAIPSSITSIGEKAFNGCSGVESVYITDLTAWCNISFGGSNSNPMNGQTVPTSLYLNGEKITHLVIPSGVEEIKSRAFDTCASIITVTIPSSVKSIGLLAFCVCKNIESVTFEDNSQLTTIDERAFVSCFALKNVVIPDSVKTISNRAFAGCSGLTSIIIPSSVTSIDEGAFNHSPNLTIYCKSAIKPTGWADDWRGSITSVYWYSEQQPTTEGNYWHFVGDVPTAWETAASAFTYAINNNEVSITGYNGSAKQIIIPSTIEGKPVVAIDFAAFRHCTSLTNISLPDSLITIGGCAFENCAGLISIDIPEGVSTIGSDAFRDCYNLTRISIPGSVTIIDEYTFNGCTSLKNITIPKGVTSIGYKAFEGCTSLTNISLPDGLTTIGCRVFEDCTSLTSIIIPSSVTSIDEGAFSNSQILTIYCESASKPTGWLDGWSGTAAVYWYSEQQPTTEGNYWHFVGDVPTAWENQA